MENSDKNLGYCGLLQASCSGARSPSANSIARGRCLRSDSLLGTVACLAPASIPRHFPARVRSHKLIQRAQEDARQTKLIHEAREEWQGVRQPHLHDVLLDQGEQSCPNRVARLAWQAGIKAQVGYKRRPDSYCGTPSVVIDNTLDRQFAVSASDAAWVTDTTFIRTHEGFAYLSVVIDLYSRRWLVGRYKVGRPLIWSARHC